MESHEQIPAILAPAPSAGAAARCTQPSDMLPNRVSADGLLLWKKRLRSQFSANILRKMAYNTCIKTAHIYALTMSIDPTTWSQALLEHKRVEREDGCKDAHRLRVKVCSANADMDAAGNVLDGEWP